MSHAKHRVVITGVGVVSSIGLGKAALIDAIKNAKSGVDTLKIIDTSGFDNHIGCEVKNFVASDWIKQLNPNNIGRASQFSIAASVMAIKDAAVGDEILRNNTCGVSLGTTEGEALSICNFSKQFIDKNIDKQNASSLSAENLSNNVIRELNLYGEPITIGTACAAGNYAISHAYDLVKMGKSNFMLCGGADSISRKAFAGFCRLGTMATEKCQPFDKNRQGMLTGEGAGILFLETLESALSRKAKIYAEILGYGMTCDAKHPVAPDVESISNCIKKAHKNANIESRMVDYVSAHGTGTKANDVTEIAALRNVFGDKLPEVSSLKSMLGHAMGAASALSCISSVLGISEQFIPPTINFQESDEECLVDCVPNKFKIKELNVVQNNAFGFGGNNCILILGKYLQNEVFKSDCTYRYRCGI